MKSKLTLIEDLGMIYATEKSKQMSRFGLYRCECGNLKKIRQISVYKNKTLSCGCLHKEAMNSFNYRHGLSNHRLYHVWTNMMSRCYVATNKRYKNYGEKGITVCKEWHNIENFIEDMDDSYQLGLSIDRIDNNKGYSKDNCRWTTRKIQSRNTRVLMSSNKSGYRGVHWHKTSKKWISQITVSSKTIYIGSFHTAINGAVAYDKYIIDNNLEHTKNF